jgi:hypothetical protein
MYILLNVSNDEEGAELRKQVENILTKGDGTPDRSRFRVRILGVDVTARLEWLQNA